MKENEDVHEPASHTKLLYVLAGFNHNLAITNKGKVLSWGFNGYSLLGRNNGKRPEKQTLNCLPLPLFTDLRERPKQKKQNKFKKRSHDVVIDD
jgi:alpha-tubulin suppressor-like RCC1 family protein